jgi:hypothetical protein
MSVRRFVAAVIVIAVAVLAGCTRTTTGTAAMAERTAVASPTTSARPSTPRPGTPRPSTREPGPTGTPGTPGSQPTIQDYIVANGIVETPLRPGDPGPRIDLPVPPGWRTTDAFGDAASYGAIEYSDTAVPSNPPRILSLLSKLTGDVDPERILDLAAGELNNLPGFVGPTEGTRDTLSGFDAVTLGGSYDDNGMSGVVAQKTVVIPADDGVYVLQFNAFADESEMDIIAAATDVVDEQTTIVA